MSELLDRICSTMGSCDGLIEALKTEYVQRRVDIVSEIEEFEKPKYLSAFWDVDRTLAKLLDVASDLNAQRLFVLVSRFRQHEGRDLAAGDVDASLIRYFKRNQDEWRRAFMLATNEIRFSEFIPLMVECAPREELLNVSNRLIELASVEATPDQSAAAVFSLGRLPGDIYDDGFLSKFSNIIDVILVRPVKHENVYRAAYLAIWNVEKKVAGSLEFDCGHLKAKVLASGSLQVLSVSASCLIENHTVEINENLENHLKQFLKVVPKYQGLLRKIDDVLYLVFQKDTAKAIKFLEAYLLAHIRENASILAFDKSCVALRKHPECLSNLTARWLLSGHLILRRAIHDITLAKSTEEDLTLCAKLSLKEAREKIVPLFYIATGWMFGSGNTCLGFAISCMRLMTKKELLSIRDDFKEVYCLNYPDEVSKYISAYKDKDTPMLIRFVGGCLTAEKARLARISNLGLLNEFKPRPADQEVYFRRRSEQFKRAYEAAAKQSPIRLVLGNPIKLIHGNRWVSYAHANGDKSVRTASDMQCSEKSTRIPHLVAKADFTLEMMLARFRMIRLRFDE